MIGLIVPCLVLIMTCGVVMFFYGEKAVCTLPDRAPKNGVRELGRDWLIPAGAMVKYTCEVGFSVEDVDVIASIKFQNGFSLQGPGVKICNETSAWEPRGKILCVKR